MVCMIAIGSAGFAETLGMAGGGFELNWGLTNGEVL